MKKNKNKRGDLPKRLNTMNKKRNKRAVMNSKMRRNNRKTRLSQKRCNNPQSSMSKSLHWKKCSSRKRKK